MPATSSHCLGDLVVSAQLARVAAGCCAGCPSGCPLPGQMLGEKHVVKLDNILLRSIITKSRLLGCCSLNTLKTTLNGRNQKRIVLCTTTRSTETTPHLKCPIIGQVHTSPPYIIGFPHPGAFGGHRRGVRGTPPHLIGFFGPGCFQTPPGSIFSHSFSHLFFCAFSKRLKTAQDSAKTPTRRPNTAPRRDFGGFFVQKWSNVDTRIASKSDLLLK